MITVDKEPMYRDLYTIRIEFNDMENYYPSFKVANFDYVEKLVRFCNAVGFDSHGRVTISDYFYTYGEAELFKLPFFDELWFDEWDKGKELMFCNIPYSWEGERPYDIDNISIMYYDKDGIGYNVKWRDYEKISDN